MTRGGFSAGVAVKSAVGILPVPLAGVAGLARNLALFQRKTSQNHENKIMQRKGAVFMLLLADFVMFFSVGSAGLACPGVAPREAGKAPPTKSACAVAGGRRPRLRFGWGGAGVGRDRRSRLQRGGLRVVKGVVGMLPLRLASFARLARNLAVLVSGSFSQNLGNKIMLREAVVYAFAMFHAAGVRGTGLPPPTTAHGPPTTSHGPPECSHGAPERSHETPVHSHGAPERSHEPSNARTDRLNARTDRLKARTRRLNARTGRRMLARSA